MKLGVPFLFPSRFSQLAQTVSKRRLLVAPFTRMRNSRWGLPIVLAKFFTEAVAGTLIPLHPPGGNRGRGPL